MLEDMVNKMKHELGQVKMNSDMKELKVQEANFHLKDAENRIRELEQKERFSKT